MSLGTILLLAIVSPFVALLTVVIGGLYLRRFQKIRPPSKEKLLRPAGESTRQRARELDEQLFFALIVTMVAPVLMIVGQLAFTARNAVLPIPRAIPIITSSAVVLVGCLTWTIWTLRRWRNYDLGFRGERSVGQHLEELLRAGCFVFHDVPGDGKWNIDHIVVTPTEILAIETKTRRKRSVPNGTSDYEVTFDGATLHFPHVRDAFGLEQARRNAKWLGDYLSRALSEPVPVRPVLALPGWMVRRKGRGDVTVVNPGELKVFARRVKPSLSSTQERRMKQIAFALEQRCRDIEF